MESDSFAEVLDLIHQEDARFDRGAYYFIRHALDHTLKERAAEPDRASRHVSGSELLEGIRDYALDQYGPLALTVFHQWNIRCCEDFGDIVFQLVDYGILGKTDRDSRSDFAGVYDFEEVFLLPFLPERKKRALPTESGRANKESGKHAN